MEALNTALSFHPDDAMAYYYLGNLYYELQPEKAIGLWEKSQTLDDGFSIVHRNLAWTAMEMNEPGRALDLYAKAFANKREDTRLMYEFDIAAARAGVSPAQRYETVFKSNRMASQQNTSTYLREIKTALNFPIGRWGNERRAQMNYSCSFMGRIHTEPVNAADYAAFIHLRTDLHGITSGKAG